jgi:hypothetical protein
MASVESRRSSMARRLPAFAALATALLLGATACRSLQLRSVDPSALGTLAGSIRGPDGIDPVKGRLVEAVEVKTGRRLQTETNALGEYSLLLPPGRYRIHVALAPGEAVVVDPGVVRLGPSELVAHADVVLGGAGVVDRG